MEDTRLNNTVEPMSRKSIHRNGEQIRNPRRAQETRSGPTAIEGRTIKISRV